MLFYFIIRCTVNGIVHVVTKDRGDFDDETLDAFREYAKNDLIKRGIHGIVTNISVSNSNYPNHNIRSSRKHFALTTVNYPSLEDAKTVRLTEKFLDGTLVRVTTEAIYVIPNHKDIDEAIHQFTKGKCTGSIVAGTESVVSVERVAQR